MLKSKRGSITFVAYVAMLFFAMYGIILLSNSISAYKLQSEAIKNIQESYASNVSTQEMISTYNRYSTPIKWVMRNELWAMRILDTTHYSRLITQ